MLLPHSLQTCPIFPLLNLLCTFLRHVFPCKMFTGSFGASFGAFGPGQIQMLAVGFSLIVVSAVVITSFIRIVSETDHSQSLGVGAVRAVRLVSVWCTVAWSRGFVARLRHGVLESFHESLNELVDPLRGRGLRSFTGDHDHAGVGHFASGRGSFLDFQERIQFQSQGYSLISCIWFGLSKFPSKR